MITIQITILNEGFIKENGKAQFADDIKIVVVHIVIKTIKLMH